jgi:hypothetical protein
MTVTTDPTQPHEYGHDFIADLNDVEATASTLAADLTALVQIYDLPGLATVKDQAWAVAYALRGMVDREVEDAEMVRQGICPDCGKPLSEHKDDA